MPIPKRAIKAKRQPSKLNILIKQIMELLKEIKREAKTSKKNK